MFTGIVKGSFPVVAVEKQPDFASFQVRLTPELVENLRIGASISVDGVCLTVTGIHENTVSFDAIEETLKRTTLSDLEENRLVHVERSLRYGDEVGGHVLSGHIFGTATVEGVDKSRNNYILTLRIPTDWMPYILPKGYIAIDGCSLTIVDVWPEGLFTVHLIPETLRLTTFSSKKTGDRVNIEIDSQTQTIVDTVQRFMVRDFS